MSFLLLIPFACWIYIYFFYIFLVDHILYYKEHAIFFIFVHFHTYWWQSFVVHGGYKLQIWHFFLVHFYHSQVHATIPRLVLHLHDDDISVRQACRVFFFLFVLPLFSWHEACWRFLNMTLSLSLLLTEYS